MIWSSKIPLPTIGVLVSAAGGALAGIGIKTSLSTNLFFQFEYPLWLHLIFWLFFLVLFPLFAYFTPRSRF